MAADPLVFSGQDRHSDGRGSAPFVTVAAFIGRTERGPVDEAVPITSFDEYRRIFGGHAPVGSVSHAVQHYFLHGGSAALVVRLVNRATRAALDIPAGNGLLRLTARRPGNRELLRVSIDYDRVEDDAKRFNLVVQRVARPGSNLVEDQELYPAVSLDPSDRRFLVDALRDSQLVRVGGPLPTLRPAATTPPHPGAPIPYHDLTRLGTDGHELTDYDIVGSNEEGTGLFALDRVTRVDLICVPAPLSHDLGTTAFLAAERYCRRRRAMLIWDPPSDWHTSDAAVLGVRALGFTSRNALTYFPRLRPRGQLGRFPAGLPACGALAGLLAAADAGAGRPSAWCGRLKASLTTVTDIGEREAERLRRFGVNPLVRVLGGGVGVDGNVCLAQQGKVATAAQRLDASRTVLHALATLERRTRWAGSEIDGAETADLLERQLRSLLGELREAGVLTGRCDDDAFFVRVTRAADAGPVTARLGFAVLGPGRFETYELVYRGGRVVTRAAAPLDAEQLVG